MKTEVKVTAIWLRRFGDSVQVLAEIDGRWKLAITENVEGPFSHIAEGNGAENWKPDPI